MMRSVLEVGFSIRLGTEEVTAVRGDVSALLGYSESDFLSGKVALRSLIHADDADVALGLFSSQLDSYPAVFNIRIRQANGRIRCIKGYGSKSVADPAGDDRLLDLCLQDAKSLWEGPGELIGWMNFKAMMENTDDYIYFKDRNHVFTGASQTLVSITSPSEHWTDLLGQTDYDVFPEEYADIYYRLEKQVFAGIEIAHERQATLDRLGNEGWVDNRKYPIHGEHGEIIGLFGVARDITAQVELERQLTHNLTVLQLAMDAAQQAVWEWDVASGEMKFSPEYYRMLGYRNDEFPANQAEWLGHIHPDDRAAVLAKVMQEVAGRKEVYLLEYRTHTKDGGYRWVQSRAKGVMFGVDGRPLKLIGIIMDIHDRKQMELQVSYLAYHDKLTDLPNRSLFFDRFSQALSQAKRNGSHVALLFADLDGFKQVNDELGHEVGDAVLKMASQRFLECVRGSDTVARFGGDEFAVILSNLQGEQEAGMVARKISAAFQAEMMLADGKHCRVGVSIGVSLFPENATTMDRLLTASDRAMYESKRAGKNTITFFGRETNGIQDEWIVFDDSHLVGIFEIDEQHRNLVRLLNRLNSIWLAGCSAECLLHIFDELVQATVDHFATEERYMALFAYPERKQHITEHALLADEAARLRSRLSDGGELLAMQTIKDWLLNHIVYSDKRLGRYLLGKGVH
jgi:diguanylate cyclase (GGDEF)-like protein/hemerythrin-like metal-binding protein/PAS domain S-box-containing protein